MSVNKRQKTEHDNSDALASDQQLGDDLCKSIIRQDRKRIEQVSEKDTEPSQQLRDNLTPLQHAMDMPDELNDSAELVRLLLAKGADPSLYQKRDQTPLSLTKQYWLKRATQLGLPTDRTMAYVDRNVVRGLMELDYAVVGQRLASQLVNRFTLARSLHDRTKIKKPAVLMFAGSSGRGKTLKIKCETVKDIYAMFGPKNPFIGYEKGSELNNFMVEHDGKPCVILLDEFEKTTQQVQEGFLNIFDNGEWSDNRVAEGKNINVSQMVFILTTNALDPTIKQFFNDKGNQQRLKQAESKSDIDQLRTDVEQRCKDVMKRLFTPAVTGRISHVVPFSKFVPEEARVVAEISVCEMCSELRLTRNLPLFVSECYYDEDLGARSIHNYIAGKLVEAVHLAFLEKEIDAAQTEDKHASPAFSCAKGTYQNPAGAKRCEMCQEKPEPPPVQCSWFYVEKKKIICVRKVKPKDEDVYCIPAASKAAASSETGEAGSLRGTASQVGEEEHEGSEAFPHSKQAHGEEVDDLGEESDDPDL
eukprot:g60694.t1